MRSGSSSRVDELVPGFEPESELERALIADPELREGLAWGKPRSGHPEGSVGAHVADLLETVDRWGERGARRADLRFLALVHDAMKYKVREWLPKVGENHHAMRARRFAERYTQDERLLGTIEQHDRPYALWRKLQRSGRLVERGRELRLSGRLVERGRELRLSGRLVERGLRRMLERIPDRDLFVRFVELDGSGEGKNPEPIEWLKRELRRR